MSAEQRARLLALVDELEALDFCSACECEGQEDTCVVHDAKEIAANIRREVES